jgi:pyrimidine-specific ribonucleoside hydrolase
MSESLGWSDYAGSEKKNESITGQNEAERHVNAKELIHNVLREAKTDVTYVCFGPMTNLAQALVADSSVGERITAVYYSGSIPEAASPSWNTARDIAAAEVVFDNPVPVISFQVADEHLLTFDQDFHEAVCRCTTITAEYVCNVHGHRRVRQLVQSEHFGCWDEMVVLGMLYPEVYLDRPPPPIGGRHTVGITRIDRTAAYYRYLDLLSGEAVARSRNRTPVVLAKYPVDPELLRDDIRPFADEIIKRHGLEEWNAALLANEFHRHLGIYSLVGVKMGIRARELLNAGVDALRVISHSGSSPPLSCLSDGLQVATGASLGRGAISLDPVESSPAAVFIKGEARLRLQLKPEISTQIESDIKNAVQKHGAITPAYWRAIRKLSIQYWLEMNRRDIFDESLGNDPERGQSTE